MSLLLWSPPGRSSQSNRTLIPVRVPVIAGMKLFTDKWWSAYPRRYSNLTKAWKRVERTSTFGLTGGCA